MYPAVVKAALERFGIENFPTRTYIVNVLFLDSADLFLYCTIEVIRTIFKEICEASRDTNVAQANGPDFSMKTMEYITVITLSIKSLVD